MLSSIFYKEWIKIGKISLLLAVVGLIIIAGFHLTVRHDLLMKDAEIYWSEILYQKYVYFSIFKFLPLITGLLIGLAQFIPETIDKRIKLSLHLPINEEGIIVKMVAIGTGIVLLIFTLFFAVIYGWGLVYFPVEIVNKTAVSILPWLFSGLAAYFLAGFVILEPIWKYRILYIITGGAFISLFYKSNVSGAYQPALLPLLAFVMMLSISSLFSIYRFRKGEM
jgi:hypothetical protein